MEYWQAPQAASRIADMDNQHRLNSFLDNATIEQKAASAAEILSAWPIEEAENILGVDRKTLLRWVEQAHKKQRKADATTAEVQILRAYAKGNSLSLSEVVHDAKLCDDVDFAACLRVKLEQLLPLSAGEVPFSQLAPLQSARTQDAVKHRIAKLADFLREYAELDVAIKGHSATFTRLGSAANA